MQKIKDIQQGDVLVFQAIDMRYRGLLCTSTYKERSPHYYTFAALNYDDVGKPEMNQILDADFFGIGNACNEHFKYANEELDQMWFYHPEIKPYYLGSYGLTIWRKDFIQFQHHFELIGRINVIDNLNKHGNGGMNAGNWEYLRKLFGQEFQQFFFGRGQTGFKVKAISRS